MKKISDKIRKKIIEIAKEKPFLSQCEISKQFSPQISQSVVSKVLKTSTLDISLNRINAHVVDYKDDIIKQLLTGDLYHLAPGFCCLLNIIKLNRKFSLLYFFDPSLDWISATILKKPVQVNDIRQFLEDIILEYGRICPYGNGFDGKPRLPSHRRGLPVIWHLVTPLGDPFYSPHEDTETGKLMISLEALCNSNKAFQRKLGIKSEATGRELLKAFNSVLSKKWYESLKNITLTDDEKVLFHRIFELAWVKKTLKWFDNYDFLQSFYRRENIVAIPVKKDLSSYFLVEKFEIERLSIIAQKSQEQAQEMLKKITLKHNTRYIENPATGLFYTDVYPASIHRYRSIFQFTPALIKDIADDSEQIIHKQRHLYPVRTGFCHFSDNGTPNIVSNLSKITGRGLFFPLPKELRDKHILEVFGLDQSDFIFNEYIAKPKEGYEILRYEQKPFMANINDDFVPVDNDARLYYFLENKSRRNPINFTELASVPEENYQTEEKQSELINLFNKLAKGGLEVTLYFRGKEPEADEDILYGK